MSLSKVRRNMRLLAIENAAQMINDHLSSGVQAEELGLSEYEFAILEEENVKISKRIMSFADKLYVETD